jgi:hypothetical protein
MAIGNRGASPFAEERSMRHGIKMFALAVLLVVTGVAITQQPDTDGPPRDKKGPPPKGGFDFLAKVVGDLNLSADQKSKAEPILKAHEEKLRELFKKLHEAAKKLDEEALDRLKTVLKDEQFQRVEDELKKGPGKDFDKKGKGDKKGPPPNKKDDAALRGAVREITAEVKDSLRQLVGKRGAGKCAD